MLLAFPSSSCGQGLVSIMSNEKPKKKAFYLVRMKPLKEHSIANNNVSFVIHCHIGKEIKHICSNCSGGEEAREGECRGAVGAGEGRGEPVLAWRGGGGCVPACAPVGTWDARLAPPQIPGKEERERGRCVLGIDSACRSERCQEGQIPLLSYGSFVLTVKAPTLLFFPSVRPPPAPPAPSCYRNYHVYRLCFVPIPMNFRSGFPALIHQLFLCRAAVVHLAQLSIWKDWFTWNLARLIFTMLSNAWGRLYFCWN